MISLRVLLTIPLLLILSSCYVSTMEYTTYGNQKFMKTGVSRRKVKDSRTGQLRHHKRKETSYYYEHGEIIWQQTIVTTFSNEKPFGHHYSAVRTRDPHNIDLEGKMDSYVPKTEYKLWGEYKPVPPEPVKVDSLNPYYYPINMRSRTRVTLYKFDSTSYISYNYTRSSNENGAVRVSTHRKYRTCGDTLFTYSYARSEREPTRIHEDKNLLSPARDTILSMDGTPLFYLVKTDED